MALGGILDAPQLSTPAVALDQRTRVLLETPVPPTLLKLAEPNMLVMLVQTPTGLFSLPGYEEGSGPKHRLPLLMQGWPYSFANVLGFIEPLAHPGRR
jgi:hypothetical protein